MQLTFDERSFGTARETAHARRMPAWRTPRDASPPKNDSRDELYIARSTPEHRKRMVGLGRSEAVYGPKNNGDYPWLPDFCLQAYVSLSLLSCASCC